MQHVHNVPVHNKQGVGTPSRTAWLTTTDISQYRLRFGSSLLYKSVFHLNRLTAQLSYEGRAVVEGGQIVFLNFTTII
jgi:hypothetical protein